VNAVSTGLRALVGRAPRSARRARAIRIPHEPLGEAHIVRKDPRIAFRVVENQMNYAYLGDRLHPAASDNFPILVGDLCAHAGQAYVTAATRAFLGQGEPSQCEFPSSQAMLDYTTHRLLWSWYRRDRDAQMDTQAGSD
jgi:hypothetical protein